MNDCELNDCEKISKCFKTILELLESRNYIINDKLKKLSDKDFRYMYSNNKYNFSVSNKENKKCNIIFFVDYLCNPKINTIREYIKKYNEDDEFIIIFRNVTTSIKKLENEKPYPNIFWYKNYIVNITKHSLVPKHQLVNKSDEEHILKIFNLQNKNQMKCILKSDPVCRFYNYKPGRIVKIFRKTDVVDYRYIK